MKIGDPVLVLLGGVEPALAGIVLELHDDVRPVDDAGNPVPPGDPVAGVTVVFASPHENDFAGSVRSIVRETEIPLVAEGAPRPAATFAVAATLNERTL